MAVGMPAQDFDPPAVEVVPGLQKLRPLEPVDGLHQPARLGRDPLHERRRHALGSPVRDERLGVARAPGAQALRVVLAPLQDRGIRQLMHVARAADVVGMHMADHDPLDRRVQLVEHRTPPRLGVARAKTGVDKDPAAARRP